VARIGGEEFAVLARGIDVAGAKQFAERLRAILASLQVTHEGQLIPLTMSIGVAHNHTGMP
jgi:diguanylate cyclase (GGDEF)-like protein